MQYYINIRYTTDPNISQAKKAYNYQPDTIIAATDIYKRLFLKG